MYFGRLGRRQQHFAVGDDDGSIEPMTVDAGERAVGTPLPTLPQIEHAFDLPRIVIDPGELAADRVDGDDHSGGRRTDEDSRCIGRSGTIEAALRIERDALFESDELLPPFELAGAWLQGEQVDGAANLGEHIQRAIDGQRRAEEECSRQIAGGVLAVDFPGQLAFGGEFVGGEAVGWRGGKVERSAERRPNAPARLLLALHKRHAAEREDALAVARERHRERVVPDSLFERMTERSQFVAARVGREFGEELIARAGILPRGFPKSVCRFAKSTATTFCGVRMRTTLPAAIGRAAEIATIPCSSACCAAAREEGFETRIVDDARLPAGTQMRRSAAMFGVAARIAALREPIGVDRLDWLARGRPIRSARLTSRASVVPTAGTCCLRPSELDFGVGIVLGQRAERGGGLLRLAGGDPTHGRQQAKVAARIVWPRRGRRAVVRTDWRPRADGRDRIPFARVPAPLRSRAA